MDAAKEMAGKEKKVTYEEAYNKLWSSPSPSQKKEEFNFLYEDFIALFPPLPPLILNKRKYSPCKHPSPLQPTKKGKESCALRLDFEDSQETEEKAVTNEEAYKKVWSSPSPSKKNLGFTFSYKDFVALFPPLPPLILNKRKYSPLKHQSPLQLTEKGKESCASKLDFEDCEEIDDSVMGWYDMDHWYLSEDSSSQMVVEDTPDLVGSSTCNESSVGSLLVDETPLP